MARTKINIKSALTAHSVKFIVQLQIALCSEHDLQNPNTEVYFKATATCIEYLAGTAVHENTKYGKIRKLRVDLEHNCLFWDYTGGKYDAVNHDEMFNEAKRLISEYRATTLQ